MFQTYNNTLCVQANWLDEKGVVSMNSLKVLTHRGKVKKARCARGLGNYALYVYESLPLRFRNVIEIDLGIDPYEDVRTIKFHRYIQDSLEARTYFSDYQLEDGRYLIEASESAFDEYLANACVFNGITKLWIEIKTANPKFSKGEFWLKVSKAVNNLSQEFRNKYPFKLPENSRSLRRKYNKYIREGYESLIHKNYCNNHREKITEEIGAWLLAYYCLPIKQSVTELLIAYDAIRESKEWPTLSESGIFNHLNKPENERVWTLARDGEEVYVKKYGHTLRREKSSLFTHAHWAIDGTKLDLIYITKDGMKAKKRINVIVDVYSEKIIGWALSETESHVDHFKAVKMAVNNTGCRPYLFTYDHQSGHKSKRMQELYSNLIAKKGVHYPHQVGRKSNPIEQLFNRLQQQVIGKRWFSDKQSIKSRQSRSTMNPDFIKKYKKLLPTEEEVIKHWLVMVDEWNGMKHPKFNENRNEVYTHEAPYKDEINTLDQISMFWLTETKPKKVYPEGLRLTVGGLDYQFEVYNEQGEIDLDFRQKYVGSKLIHCYDPDFLEDFIKLYRLDEKEQKHFVAYAEKKRAHKQVPVLMKKGDRELVMQDLKVRNQEMNRDWGIYLKISQETGLTVESLIDQDRALIDPELALKMGSVEKDKEIAGNSASLYQRLEN